MNWDMILFLLVFKIVQADHDLIVNKIISIMSRRNLDDEIILMGSPTESKDLPKSEPMVPGHTLIQPETGMLQSAVKFPQDSMANAVYGNMDQLSITYGKTPNRILYTGFRKATSLLDSTIRQAIRNIQLYNGGDKSLDSLQYKSNEVLVSDEENSANEILDKSSSLESEENTRRRSSHKKKSKEDKSSKEKKDSKYISDSENTSSSVSSSSSDSSDYDKNPGNAYTLYKGKYKQNYLWNHFMDGDHMNINPFGPSFNTPGPSGAELFFGRKWWYFNQDDFKPLG